MVSRVPPEYIIALRCHFGGFGVGKDDARAYIVPLDMGHALQPMLDPRMGLTCAWLPETAKGGAYACRLCRQALTCDMQFYCPVPDTICRRVCLHDA